MKNVGVKVVDLVVTWVSDDDDEISSIHTPSLSNVLINNHFGESKPSSSSGRFGASSGNLSYHTVSTCNSSFGNKLNTPQSVVELIPPTYQYNTLYQQFNILQQQSIICVELSNDNIYDQQCHSNQTTTTTSK